jgi:Asp-tRNA(Asn)/Glu-tRNA(Gln) amidotransferase A subunit family amidase
MTLTSGNQGLLPKLAASLRSSEGALARYLDWLEARFEELEPRLHAYVGEADRFGRLRQQAEQLLAAEMADQRPAMFGMPVGVKDIFHVSGFETRAGSKLPVGILQGEQAESVSRLRRAGALIGGKTVTTEFAYFAPGPTTNPHQVEHTPGGSSSGSAAAVAAGLAPLALGTQTIGSINRPAAFCGAFGFKPSFGRISTRGVIPLSPSLDHVGFFTPDAGSAAWAAAVLLEEDTPTSPAPDQLRFAIPIGDYLDRAEDEGRQHFEMIVRELESAGHSVVEIPCMPDFEAIVTRHQLILAAECAQVHAAWFEANAGYYHPKASALIERGQAIPQVDLEQALPGLQGLRTYLEELMDEHHFDGWLTPSAPGPAPFGLESTGDPVMNLPWTQSGLPSVTLPSGFSSNGLPLGLQVIAHFGQDAALLEWAQLLEPVLNFPPIHGLDECLEAIT